MTITSATAFDLVRIYFGTVCHLAFIPSKVIGWQSWNSPSTGTYTIEISFKSGATMVTEYDFREKWERVLVLIDEAMAGNLAGKPEREEA